jgi:hypothetical protein
MAGDSYPFDLQLVDCLQGSGSGVERWGVTGGDGRMRSPFQWLYGLTVFDLGAVSHALRVELVEGIDL